MAPSNAVPDPATTSTQQTEPRRKSVTGHSETATSMGPAAPGEAKPASSNVTNSTQSANAPAPPTTGEKLSGAELKKRKQEEKAARRAQAKSQPGAVEQTAPSKGRETSSTASKKTGGTTSDVPSGRPQHKRTASAQKGLPVRPAPGLDIAAQAQSKKDAKKVALFGHLYGQPRRTTLAGASKDVHPAILALGLQISSYAICGSAARCVATLLAFKKVIESYTTPHNNSLPRHLTLHLSSQIDYLKSCRPLATTTGNAIRWLKLEISLIDPSADEDEAKADLCADIDRFIQERITFADRAIAATVVSKLQDNDTILTFGKSNIVQQTLLAAHAEGKQLNVVVVDSRPLFEGRDTARTLANAGLNVQYTLTHGLAKVIKSTTRVLLGAHSMLGNGRLYARAGSALVAMMAKHADVPVIVCCESLKFTDRVALDSIVTNEVAPAEELIIRNGGEKGSTLDDWKQKDGLQLLNLMYDLTPAEYVAMVVTEYGCLPPTSVPVVHRLSTNT